MSADRNVCQQSGERAALRCLVKMVLQQPLSYSWTVQGFGMMRTYLSFDPNPKRFRLNVWNGDLAVPGVSVIHDHPWDFTSWVINGDFGNVRYVEDHFSGEDYEWMQIKCGEAGCSISAPARIRLRDLPFEAYRAGSIYCQTANEIHRTVYGNGTVTLNDRIGDTEQARVFWPAGQKWVDAKPRAATTHEIIDTADLALQGWQDEIAHS